MRIAFAVLIVIHGVIHLLGPTKAFGWGEVSQLRAPISPLFGVLWLVAAVLLMLAAAGLVLRTPGWWYLALAGVLLSQALIVTAWSDARFGTIANLIIAVPVAMAILEALPSSFRSRFERDRDLLLRASPTTAPLVTEADLASLPPLVQNYLRRIGTVGRPRIRNFRVTFAAQMRSSPTAPWMEATATQYEFFTRPARLFHMKATRAGLPFDVLHRYLDGAATFQVRILGLIPMVNKEGPAITHDETVTLMNDVLVLAPAAVLDLPFTFETLDPHAVRARFSNAGYEVSAILTFDAAGDLVGFTSADRAHAREEGAATWSTPISDYRLVDGIRVGSRGDANWIDSAGEWTYGRFQVTSLAYNVAR